VAGPPPPASGSAAASLKSRLLEAEFAVGASGNDAGTAGREPGASGREASGAEGWEEPARSGPEDCWDHVAVAKVKRVRKAEARRRRDAMGVPWGTSEGRVRGVRRFKSMSLSIGNDGRHRSRGSSMTAEVFVSGALPRCDARRRGKDSCIRRICKVDGKRFGMDFAEGFYPGRNPDLLGWVPCWELVGRGAR
jgi:hypothetical protein